MQYDYYQNIEGWFDFPNFYRWAFNEFQNGVFVEIGVFQGKSLMFMAENIKESGKDIKLYGIDTFEGTGPNMLKEYDLTPETLYERYSKNIEPFKDIITTIKGKSQEVHTQFEDESIDFLFIDGDHSYEPVRNDLTVWYPKVKNGGIISGHDYDDVCHYGVIKAVNEFFGKKNVNLYPTIDKDNYVWYIKKASKMYIHPKGYWIEIDELNKHGFDQSLCKAIADTFLAVGVKTAVDIGCGDGSYTRYLIKRGIECTGYDGNPITPKLSHGLCEVKDFSDPQDLGQFDLVLSLEVGEHIPKKWEQVFIDNLCRASKKYICLSWAIEGQPGFGHFNCQNNDYVIKEMAKRGFKYCPKTSKIIRDESDKVKFPWFFNTLLIFKR